MKNMIILALLIPMSLSAGGDSSMVVSTHVQQRALYFTSDRVTMMGIGPAIGAQAIWDDRYIAQTDIAILWANGNCVPVRFGFGIQSSGDWSPAVMGTVSLLWGQRTEVLTASGIRPDVPVWAVGIAVTPLRFRGSFGYASAFELGFGLGPDNGLCFDVNVLSIGFRW